MRLTRRAVLGSALALPACRGDPLGRPGSATMPVADAHLHLFNVSDLPIAGFIEHVYLPTHFAAAPAWALAAIDLFATFYKPLAVTAAREARQSARAQLSPGDFGRRTAAFIATRRRDALTRDADPLARSYDALSRAVAVDVLGDRVALGAEAARDQRLNAAAFTRAAEAQDRNASDNLDLGDRSVLSGAGRLIGWGFLMLQSRGSHLDRYLARFGSADASPRLVASLIVDYDSWLDDRPAAGSDQLAQIAAQRAAAARRSERVDVRVLAGFCPLRHAIDTAAGRATLLSRLEALEAAGVVAGYKVYPPMGFLPWGNASLADEAFDAGGPSRRNGLRAWREVSTRPLGPALDAALDQFYRHCAATGAPIVAHAGPGNGAGPGYGERANPRFWERAVSRHRLRLSLGHLVNEAEPFVRAVKAGTPFPGSIWSLDAPLRMLDRRRSEAPDVYGDLAYMPELVASPELAREFFVCLRQTFGPGDIDLTRVMYGTDWIMLGLEAGDDRFLGAVEVGMRAAGYTSTQRDNILWDNARRFLRVA